MKEKWNFISNVGITPSLPSDEVRLIILLNRLCCIVCIFLAGYIPFLYLFGEKVMVPFLFAEILLFGLTFYLVHKQKYNAAKTYFLINTILFLGFVGIMPGKESADKFLLIASAVLPLLFFRRMSYILSFFLVNILLFFSIYTYQRYYPPLLQLPPLTISIFYYFNLATTFILIFLVIYYFKGLNEEYQVKLVEKNKIIEEKNKDITDSIQYAKRIQDAILASDDELHEALNSHFVLFKPRDVVSGDFYWIYQTKDTVIWTAADCTGHGVPGAFMSMIGNSLLNEIIIEKGITEADKILNELRESIISTLGQTGKQEETRDGMDMALCVWHKDSNWLEFSGANNPLYLIRKSIAGTGFMPDEHVIIYGEDLAEIKGDKQPIAYEEGKDRPFTGHRIKLQEGDTLYTFSDGYQDQMGGEMDKKFMAKRLKELLVSIQDKAMEEQKEILDRTIEDWKGNNSQVDDICVIGVRI